MNQQSAEQAAIVDHIHALNMSGRSHLAAIIAANMQTLGPLPEYKREGRLEGVAVEIAEDALSGFGFPESDAREDLAVLLGSVAEIVAREYKGSDQEGILTLGIVTGLMAFENHASPREIIDSMKGKAGERESATGDHWEPDPPHNGGAGAVSFSVEQLNEEARFSISDQARRTVEQLADGLPPSGIDKEGEGHAQEPSLEDVLAGGDVHEVRDYLNECFGNVSMHEAASALASYQAEQGREQEPQLFVRSGPDAERLAAFLENSPKAREALDRAASPLDKARERNNTPEAKAERQAAQRQPTRDLER